MWNKPTPDQLAALPGMYETDGVPMGDKIVHMHLFLGGCDWYLVEYDGEDTFFGYAIINGDRENGEWGYISLRELDAVRVRPGLEVDRDRYWRPRPAREVPQIRLFD